MGIINEMIRRDNTVEIAKNLLRKGLSIELVSETTGLDEPTILDLQAELAVA